MGIYQQSKSSTGLCGVPSAPQGRGKYDKYMTQIKLSVFANRIYVYFIKQICMPENFARSRLVAPRELKVALGLLLWAGCPCILFICELCVSVCMWPGNCPLYQGVGIRYIGIC